MQRASHCIQIFIIRDFSCSVRGFIAQIFRLPQESVFYDALRLSDVEQSRANKSPAKPSDHHTSQGDAKAY